MIYDKGRSRFFDRAAPVPKNPKDGRGGAASQGRMNGCNLQVRDM